jgi:hypothetical protein
VQEAAYQLIPEAERPSEKVAQKARPLPEQIKWAIEAARCGKCPG